MTKLQNDKWQNDKTEKWQNNKMTLFFNDKIAKWQNINDISDKMTFSENIKIALKNIAKYQNIM